jgi:hypothetical protein
LQTDKLYTIRAVLLTESFRNGEVPVKLKVLFGGRMEDRDGKSNLKWWRRKDVKQSFFSLVFWLGQERGGQRRTR